MASVQKRSMLHYEDWTFVGSSGLGLGDHWILRRMARKRMARRKSRRVLPWILRAPLLPRRILQMERRLEMVRWWLQSVVFADSRSVSLPLLRRKWIWAGIWIRSGVRVRILVRNEKLFFRSNRGWHVVFVSFFSSSPLSISRSGGRGYKEVQLELVVKELISDCSAPGARRIIRFSYGVSPSQKAMVTLQKEDWRSA
jgi:hypothetical protein